ncbi:MAG: hypothetical protein N2316_03345 [Spirochaetes bacterium]|nr:hypothetical protein [Spirochaetota bacterium]
MKKNSILVAMLIIAAMFFVQCQRKEIKFERALVEYCNNPNEKNRANAIRLLVVYGRVESFSHDVQFECGMVFRAEKDAIRCLWPNTATIENVADKKLLAVDHTAGRFGFLHRNEIAIFNRNGDEILAETLFGEGDVVGMHFIGENLYLLRANKLLMRTNKGEMREAISEPVFDFIPSAQKHRTAIQAVGNVIAINCGTPGAYRLTVVDVGHKKIVIKGLENASFRFGMWRTAIAYIAGASGNWSLCAMNVSNKRAKTIQQFTAVEDVAFTDEFAVVREKGTMYMYNIELEKRCAMPAEYDVVGAGVGYILLQDNSAFHLVDAKNLFAGLQKIEECNRK